MKKLKKHEHTLTISEKISIVRIMNPQQFILLGLMAFNVIFFFIASLVIYALLPYSIGRRGYWECLYHAITMVLDAGCISNLIEDVGSTGTGLIVSCVVIVVLGMVLFTGGAIGYVANFIGNVIDNTNSGKWQLRASGHTVILNWNNRASEIINDMLFSEHKEIVVVLSNSNSDQIIVSIYNFIQSVNDNLF